MSRICIDCGMEEDPTKSMVHRDMCGGQFFEPAIARHQPRAKIISNSSDRGLIVLCSVCFCGDNPPTTAIYGIIPKFCPFCGVGFSNWDEIKELSECSVEDFILSRLPCSPLELLPKSKFSDGEIKETLSNLLASGKIELTPNRMLIYARRAEPDVRGN